MNLGNRHSQHSFSQIPTVNQARSKFDRSFAVKDTMDFDELTPFFVDEVLPGDTINLNVKSFCRLANQVVPLLDNMYIDYFFFFVPNRLVWDNWEKFNGAQSNPGDSTSYLIPTITVNQGAGVGFTVGSIYDKMGLPTGVDDITINALPLRAYYLIWNKWFRDENLQNSLTISTGDGPDLSTAYAIQKRGKRHDYFTSALPWPQKGTAVSLPLGTSASLTGNADVWGSVSTLAASPYNEAPILHVGQSSSVNYRGKMQNALSQEYMTVNSASTPGATQTDIVFLDKTLSQAHTAGATAPFKLDKSTVTVDLSTATAATINQLRQAFMTQSLLELDARGGTRYVEILKAHFGVISPDFRLQRPEFLSMGTITIDQHPVAQTSQTSGTDYLAQLAAFSTASNMSGKIGFSKSFVEHGYVIGLVSARGDLTYQQGINKMWSRSTRYDFFWPKLQELGEQAILNQEIYATEVSATNSAVFGYQERYAEYRYKPSEIRGQFRSTFATPLDVWHLAEEFGSLPALNSTFIVSNTPIERSLVVAASYPHLLCDYWFDYKHARPIMAYGVPANLGRF